MSTLTMFLGHNGAYFKVTTSIMIGKVQLIFILTAIKRDNHKFQVVCLR